MQKAWNGQDNTLAWRSSLLHSGFYLNNQGHRRALPDIPHSLPLTISMWIQCLQVKLLCCFWLPQIQKYFFILFLKSSFFFPSGVILTSHNSIKPALQLHSYLEIKSWSKFSPREKAAHSHKYVFWSFAIPFDIHGWWIFDSRYRGNMPFSPLSLMSEKLSPGWKSLLDSCFLRQTDEEVCMVMKWW